MEKLIKLGLLVGVLYFGMKILGFGPQPGDEMASLVARAEVDGKDKIVVLFTGTSWCSACKTLDDMVTGKPEWNSFIRSEALYVKYEYGPSERPKTGPKGEMLQKFDIEGFPTMIVMDGKGNVLEEIVGYNRDGLKYYKSRISRL